MPYTMGNSRVNRIFSNVAAGAKIVVSIAVLRQRAALHLHFMGGLPGADNDLADPAHGLGI